MCGIFGLWNVKKAAEQTAIGLHVMQYRGVDRASIVSTNGTNFFWYGGAGIARDVFAGDILNFLHGERTLGHVRYPTVVAIEGRNDLQPLRGTFRGMPITLSHNGNLTNVEQLGRLIPQSELVSSTDSEYILRLIERHQTGTLEEALIAALKEVTGSYALAVLSLDRLIVARDPQGNRPLSIGTVGDGFCVASETCAFPAVDATHLCDVEAGTLVSIGSGGLKTTRFAKDRQRKCRFEGIYFAHPASVVFGEKLMQFRVGLGVALEAAAPAPGADIVVPVPDSANDIAKGYARSGRSGVLCEAIRRSHYVGRTFIIATQSARESEVKQKFTFAAEEIAGKSVVLVDDSVVRGTTMQVIVKMIRALGARKINVRIACPEIRHPCIYGINTPTYKELISAARRPEEICAQIGADSLAFLPLVTLEQLSDDGDSFCYACMNGKYWYT